MNNNAIRQPFVPPMAVMGETYERVFWCRGCGYMHYISTNVLPEQIQVVQCPQCEEKQLVSVWKHDNLRAKNFRIFKKPVLTQEVKNNLYRAGVLILLGITVYVWLVVGKIYNW